MKTLKIMATGVVIALAMPAPTQTINPDQYKVPIFSGLRASPDFTGAGREHYRFRTAMRDGFRYGPVVAGHYALIRIGCGMECIGYSLGDLRTGKILSFPIGGEYFPSLDLTVAPDSRLIIAKWGSSSPGDGCTVRIYALTGSKFMQIGMDKKRAKDCSQT